MNSALSFVWLNQAYNQIKKTFDINKMPHGLLVVAPSGGGKGLLANIIAKSILCEKTTLKLEQACGQCKHCLLVKSKSHPDLMEVSFLKDTKGKEKKSIGIDQIRVLNEKLVETSQLGGWRIVIVASVEGMTRGAFNAILKTLEEPGERTLLLMLANSVQQVPATIKSRCQMLHLDSSEDSVIPWLSQEANCSREVAIAALKTCHYSPFSALDYIVNDDEKEHNKLFEALDNVLKTNLSPAEFIQNYSHDEAKLWAIIADYYHSVQISLLNYKNKEHSEDGFNYKDVPLNMPILLYTQLIDYNRAQSMGSNLQANLQLEAILTQWFELGRKIVHYSSRL